MYLDLWPLTTIQPGDFPAPVRGRGEVVTGGTGEREHVGFGFWTGFWITILIWTSNVVAHIKEWNLKTCSIAIHNNKKWSLTTGGLIQGFQPPCLYTSVGGSWAPKNTCMPASRCSKRNAWQTFSFKIIKFFIAFPPDWALETFSQTFRTFWKLLRQHLATMKYRDDRLNVGKGCVIYNHTYSCF